MSDAREIQAAIAADPEATSRVLAYLDARGIAHSGQISGATLAAVCGKKSRTWRKWAGGEREMPEAAKRLLEIVAWEKRLAELEAKVRELEYWAQFACETPAPGCDCPGCSLSREENK